MKLVFDTTKPSLIKLQPMKNRPTYSIIGAIKAELQKGTGKPDSSTRLGNQQLAGNLERLIELYDPEGERFQIVKKSIDC